MGQAGGIGDDVAEGVGVGFTDRQRVEAWTRQVIEGGAAGPNDFAACGLGHRLNRQRVSGVRIGVVVQRADGDRRAILAHRCGVVLR